MTLLVLGVLLWAVPHLFKRIMPDARAKMGDKAKLMVTVTSFLALVLMVIGYRNAEIIQIYTPMAGMGHLNNVLMLVSVYLFGVGGTKGVLYPKTRHPMLLGTVIWAGAHLLVNGDVASLILFGGMGLWALLSIVAINRSTTWTPPTNGRGIKGDAMNIVGTLVLFGIIAMVHVWLGHSPFLGTYP